MGFGLIIRFIEHLQFVTTNNYIVFINLHIMQITTANTKSSICYLVITSCCVVVGSLYNLGTDCIQNTASKNSSIIVCLFIAMETCLPCNCQVMDAFIHSTVLAFNCPVTILLIGNWVERIWDSELRGEPAFQQPHNSFTSRLDKINLVFPLSISLCLLNQPIHIDLLKMKRWIYPWV
jgi:hypothetical protein